ncbi:TonB-dependent receptor domain-containing protein [Aureibacter tunicatorum]|uniref:Outer membrane receptor for ferrienterochelin and colicin n=1 Tax=Aureibacter tunicatorum TaxID=866807 RepID=A0AAE3XRJ3_9BACT|nr:TonB-dependent receptor [Aureibacter tunicatorum]MDR6241297.1 outer membrane receptor for ferrienterochelin and colicin [Aureibacter tunicatorum]BDD03557.1 TonB-dependent receptor [Aureibacter tunicatorum]
MSRNLFSLVAIMLLSIANFSAYSQYVIKGKVVNKSNEAQPFANIVVKSEDKTQLVKGGTSSMDGSFSVSLDEKGKYFFQVSMMGYETYAVESLEVLDKTTDMGTVKLEDALEMLEAVSVTSTRQAVQVSPGMQTINVTSELLSLGGNAEALLKAVPAVEISPKGNIEVRGSSNILFLINGKRSVMGMNPKQLLKMLPLSAIERVEVITTPSPKYDSEGVDSIINIILKKGAMDGFGMSAGVEWSPNPSMFGGNMMASYRKGDWNVTGAFGYFTENYPYEVDNERIGEGVGLVQKGDGKEKTQGYFTSINLGYEISEGESLDFEVGHMNFEQRSDLTQKNSFGENQSSIVDTKSNIDFKGTEMSLNYGKEFTKARKLDMLSNFSFGKSDGENNIVEQGIESNQTLIHNNAKYRMGEIKLDYIDSLGSRIKLESGMSANLLSFNVDQNNERSDFQERYKFLQQQYALYAMAKISFNKLMIGVGGRLQYFNSDGKEQVNNVDIDQSFVNPLPNVMLQYNISEGKHFHIVSMIYNKKINRPSYEQLNPVMNIEDPYNVVQGNINLKPEKVHNMELFHQIRTDKLQFSTTIFGRNTQDVIQRINTLKDDVVLTTFENYSQSYALGIENKSEWEPMEMLEFSAGFTAQKRWFPDAKSSTVDMNKTGYAFSANGSVTVRTGSGPTVTLRGNYFGKNVQAFSYREAYSKFDINVSQNILKGLVTLGVNAEDLFNSAGKEIWVTNGDGFENRTNWRTFSRRVSFSIYFNFM